MSVIILGDKPKNCLLITELSLADDYNNYAISIPEGCLVSYSSWVDICPCLLVGWGEYY